MTLLSGHMILWIASMKTELIGLTVEPKISTEDGVIYCPKLCVVICPFTEDLQVPELVHSCAAPRTSRPNLPARDGARSQSRQLMRSTVLNSTQMPQSAIQPSSRSLRSLQYYKVLLGQCQIQVRVSQGGGAPIGLTSWVPWAEDLD